MTSQQIDAEALYQSLVAQLRTRMAGTPAGDWSVAGIVSGGAWIAARLAHDLGLREYGIVNVALHRDDYAKKGLHAQAQPTTLPFEVEERRILLVDDVLATGRTIRAAINELFDYGRPAAVELAVLVDRGERQLPIAPDYIGERIALAADESLVLRQEGEGASARFTFTREPKAA
ncbi:bifunctional pyr operon transcriptional regulator/uracil phosphoribosyltransferase PyrR [Ralstonia pseudosolanacearum]|uniref:bifunctional pyr operon transcriptional regulator/uracil phosphoribosyltransferase PyrR n=1 Tax=Ralstonia pseudosolanacearum TaxID=1310165 RepID=UPI0002E048A9|nr:bifunctional pyr operon transcriptional regulator/uracil phosphoribosyltransferase PyrR [Ralstonia pseudosolanacearum]AOE88816.1 Uracil phosphoribosyltransferase [Ralstonia solanacearum]APF88003.1 bifunctional pyr operon transcriptional regulator/uracil phosphoribosyltransferase [Ralstonia solanacearum FJAT-1458]ARS55247.1 bifunctional pyr operon transcriptional regulator/uracil phosphoribosyltransferase [Ralstonia solanacearum FJAT-91]ESS48492.1 pyrimidine regulatory protein PyrR [Ralstonia